MEDKFTSWIYEDTHSLSSSSSGDDGTPHPGTYLLAVFDLVLSSNRMFGICRLTLILLSNNFQPGFIANILIEICRQLKDVAADMR